MGLVRTVAKALVARVAKVVEKNNLFEKPGERQHQPKLPDSDESEEPAPATRAVPVVRLAEALQAADGPLLIHHWATWCEPCEEELPLVEGLARDGVQVIGVSWDRFQDFRAVGETVDSVRSYAEAMGLSWPSLVADGSPEELFSSLGLDFQKVPQSRLVAPDGKVLLQVDGVLSSSDLEAIRARAL